MRCLGFGSGEVFFGPLDDPAAFLHGVVVGLVGFAGTALVGVEDVQQLVEESLAMLG